MDTFLSGLVITSIAVFIGFVLRMLYNKLYKKPIISLQLIEKKVWTKQRHFRGEDSSDPNTDLNEVFVYFNNIWNFQIIIKNRSRSNAYEIRFSQLKEIPNLRFNNGLIDKDLVLEHNQKQVISLSYEKTYRIQRKDKDKYFTDLPQEFYDLMILVSFKNNHDSTFHRIYYFKNDTTKDSPISIHELEHWETIV